MTDRVTGDLVSYVYALRIDMPWYTEHILHSPITLPHPPSSYSTLPHPPSPYPPLPPSLTSYSTLPHPPSPYPPLPLSFPPTPSHPAAQSLLLSLQVLVQLSRDAPHVPLSPVVGRVHSLTRENDTILLGLFMVKGSLRQGSGEV